VRLLRAAGLQPPVRQQVVRDRGRFVARVDLSYPHERLILEADGYPWHSGRAAWERDVGRRNTLTRLGWRVVHVTWADVTERPQETIATIREVLLTRAAI
jgi:very-short-patch-repair endonuclease